MKKSDFPNFWNFYDTALKLPAHTLLDEILKRLDIKNEKDLDTKLKVDEWGFIQNIDDVLIGILFYAACKNIIEETLTAHKQCDSFFFHDTRLNDFNLNYLNSYVNFFPSEIVIHTRDLYINCPTQIEDSKLCFNIGGSVGTDILRLYLKYRDLIISKQIYIFPQAIFPVRSSSKYVNIPTCNKYKNKCFLEGLGTNPDIIPNLDYENLVLELPWIQNAKIEDFMELKNKYKKEYMQFHIQTKKLLAKVKAGESIENLLAKEYNEASLEIQSIMLKRKAELKKKGIELAVGTICTILPIVLEKSGLTSFDPQIFSSVVGGATIYNGIKDFFKRPAKDNPYWIMYKWEQETEKRIYF